MTLNPDLNKQAQEVLFLVQKKTRHPPLNFNGDSVKQVKFQKHLGVFYLDNKFDFREHLQNMFKKVNKKTSLLSKLQNNLPTAPLVTISKLFG